MTFPLPVDYRQLSPGSSPAQDEDLEFADALDPQSGKKLPRKLGAEKRAVHNKIERARRESLNGRFQQLAAALPMSNVKKDKRASKSAIVSQALAFVCTAQLKELALTKENNELRIEVNTLRARLGMSLLPAPTPLPVAVAPAALAAASPTENSTPPATELRFTNSFLSTASDHIDSPTAAEDASDDGAMDSPPPSSTRDRKPSFSQNSDQRKVYSSTPVNIPTQSTASLFDHALVKEETSPYSLDSLSASTTGMLPAPIPFANFPTVPAAPYYPSYDPYMQRQLQQQLLEQQAQLQYAGYLAPSIISSQHAAMVSAHLQQAHHQRIYQDYPASSSLGSNASTLHSLSPQSSSSSLDMENSPRSFSSNDLSLFGSPSTAADFSFAGMNGMSGMGGMGGMGGMTVGGDGYGFMG